MRNRKYSLLLICTLVYSFIMYEISKDGSFNASLYNTIQSCTENNKCRLTRKDTNINVKHLAFLKVPKTGSSTLQNVIFRFGLKNNLSIYIPNDKYFLSTQEQQILMNTSVSYDIFMIHTIYNTEFFRHFPTSESASIALIRKPFDRFISAAYYMRDVVHAKYLERIPRENYIQNLLGNSEKYDKGFFSPTRNLMGKFFGFSEPVTEKDTKEIKQYLDKVNSEILLVLILERFEESLVLLRRLLSWSFSNILYLKLNSHYHEQVDVENSLKEKLKTTCFLDDQIYTYFTNELDNKIAQVGPAFQTEVEHFRNILHKVTVFCSSNRTDSVYVEPRSQWEDKFIVTPDDCTKMRTNDTDFFDIFRLRQKEIW